MSDGMFQQNSLTEHAIESFNIIFYGLQYFQFMAECVTLVQIIES